MTTLRGWRYGILIGSLVGGTALALYPIVIEPMMNIDKYKQIQERNRTGIAQENIQPGNMKVWTDPFDRRKPPQ